MSCDRNKVLMCMGSGRGRTRGTARAVLLLKDSFQILEGEGEIGTHADSCTKVQAVR
jgi:hypothetical protein